MHARHDNVLIRSGEALAIGWSRNMLYSGFDVLPRSVFWSAYFNGRSDNTDDYEVQSLGSQFLIFFCDRFYRRTFFFEIEPNV